MCGIVGYVGKKSVVPVIIEGLRRLEYRGYDSAGIAVSGIGQGLELRRAEGKLRNLEEVIRQRPIDGTYGIGHTRWATHGRRSPSRHATLYTESSDRFVASAAASIATGWSEPVPGRELHPLKSSAFHGALFRQLRISGFCFANQPLATSQKLVSR